MSDRNQQILRQLVIHQTISEAALMKKFDISARQLEYSIEAINDRLSEKKLPPVEKVQGRYISNQGLASYLTRYQTMEDILFSVNDRIDLIIILILTRSEELSLNHFVFDLGVSKNTAVSDIKKAKEFLQQKDMTISFSRKDGYFIEGNEWDKRYILMQAIMRIYRNYGAKIAAEVMSSSQEFVLQMTEFIQKAEHDLQIKYNDEIFQPLIRFLSAVLLRIQRGRNLSIGNFSKPTDIENTKEFSLLNQSAPLFPVKITHAELLYLTLQLLSANGQNKSGISEVDMPLLSASLWEFLNEFENKTFLIIADKKGLLTKLLNHFKPAYYRIKYHLSNENVLYDRILDEYKVLHDFVRQSIGPLEAFFDEAIDDQEIAYITLFVGGHLIANEPTDFEAKIVKAVIVCPNGISMSKLIEKKLKETFPEFFFYPTSSIRAYKKFILPHDIVFSTIPLNTDKKVYVIEEIISNSQQLQLRNRVIRDVYHLDFDQIRLPDLLKVIRQHAEICDEKQLEEDLESLLLKDLAPSESFEQAVTSNEILRVLSEDFITIGQHEMGWEEAFEAATEPLLQNELISPEFKQLVLQEYSEQPGYILLKQRVLLPHLDPTRAKQKLGISLLLNPYGIHYGKKKVYLMAVLTTPDKTSHLNLLYGINRVASNSEAVTALSALTEKQEIIQCLQKSFRGN